MRGGNGKRRRCLLLPMFCGLCVSVGHKKTGVPKEACIRWEKDQFWGISYPVVKYRKSGMQSMFDVFVNYY